MERIRLRRDRPAINRLIQGLGLGSRHEGMAVLHAFGDVGRPVWVAPLRLDYRQLPVTDDLERVVGDRPQPAIFLPGDTPILLFPQLNVKFYDVPGDYPHRGATMDFLALVRVDNKHNVWVLVEVDGEHHDAQNDPCRTRLIGLPRLQVTPAHLRREDFIPWLRAELESLARTHLKLPRVA